jgi:regulator of protease activity HflC (stomatin/prohibitin superfamily)
MSKVDLRIVTLTVPPQEVITRDDVTIRVTAVIYFYVLDPIAAVVNVVNFNQASTPAHEPLNGSRNSEQARSR